MYFGEVSEVICVNGKNQLCFKLNVTEELDVVSYFFFSFKNIFLNYSHPITSLIKGTVVNPIHFTI